VAEKPTACGFAVVALAASSTTHREPRDVHGVCHRRLRALLAANQCRGVEASGGHDALAVDGIGRL
jgi:hypothetical protein